MVMVDMRRVMVRVFTAYYRGPSLAAVLVPV